MKSRRSRSARGFHLCAFSAAVLGVTLVGCGKGVSLDKESARIGPSGEPGLALHAWENSCQDNDYPSEALRTSFSNLGIKLKRFYKFTGPGFKESVRFYSDSACQTPSAELQYEGSFNVRDPIAVGNAGDARAIDLTYERVNALALSDDVSRKMHAQNFFGVSTWYKGTRIDLTDRTNEPASLLRALPFTRHDVEEVSFSDLRFGKVNLAPEAVAPKTSDRPYALDVDDIYHPSNRSW